MSVRRNRIIADIFSKTPCVEQIGSGIKRMKELLKNADLPILEFEMNSFFIVVFKKKELVNEGVNILFEFIKNKPDRRAPYLEKQLKIPIKTLERWLKKLKEDGKIEFKGSSKTGGYFTKKQIKK